MIKTPLLKEDLSIPLCVDLDGTLIKEDTTRTAAFLYGGLSPLKWAQIALWFARGKHAYMKEKLSEKINLSKEAWAFSKPIIELMKQEKKRGRPLYLVSATDIRFAKTLVKLTHRRYEEFFKEGHIIATRGKECSEKGIVNLRAQAKADWLIETFGIGKFIYAGNSTDDLKVWAAGATPVIMSCQETQGLAEKLKTLRPETLILSNI